MDFCANCSEKFYPQKPTPAKSCWLCQNLQGEAFVLELLDRIKQGLSPYSQVETITLCITVPGIVSLRERLLNTVLGFPSLSFVKDSLKGLLQRHRPSDFPLISSGKEDADVQVAVVIENQATTQEEFSFLSSKFYSDALPRSGKRGHPDRCTVRSIEQLFSGAGRVQAFFESNDLAILPVRCSEYDVQVSFRGRSVFVAGLYNKWRRNVSQTPWVISGERLTSHSVSEIVEAPLQRLFRNTSSRFCSAGREDSDVRMLGSGRPFYVELVDVRDFLSARSFSKDAHSFRCAYTELAQDTEIASANSLSIVDGGAAKIAMKEGEEEKDKVYRCVIWCSAAVSRESLQMLDSLQDVDIKQRTPIRVLQRRALMVREKRIYEFSAQPLDLSPNYFILHLRTEAGVYVKEFVHGDLGRTVPSLKTLLFGSDSSIKIDILELDVLSVNLPDWPPTT